MSRKREEAKRIRQKAWERALWDCYRTAHARIQPKPEHDVPGEVLVADAIHYFPPVTRPETGFLSPNLAPPEQYMGSRLLGLGNSKEERHRLAESLRDLRGGLRPAGVGPISKAGRRSEPAGKARRNKRSPRS